MSDNQAERGNDWTAIHNHMPGGGELVLRVSGTVWLPTPGYSNVELEQERSGINPLIVRLRVTADAPTNPQNEVVTPYPEIKWETTSDTEYESVTIEAGESGALELPVTVEVQHPQ
jgi:hypothetical protein